MEYQINCAEGADSLVFFDFTDSGVKREPIGDFLTVTQVLTYQYLQIN